MGSLYPRVLAFIERLPEAKTVADSWAAFQSFAGYYGFSCGAIADLPDASEQFANKVLCVNWPQEWQDRYLAQNYVSHDPAVLHLGQTILPYTWNDLLATPSYSKSERKIVLEARDFSLNTGLIIPLPALRSGSAIMTMAGDNVQVSQSERAEIHLAGIYAHSYLRSLIRPGIKKVDRKITARERECLHWAASGKSDWEISEILSISKATANAHIESAKRKFNVATRVQAIIIAVKEGIIRP